jgi:hypothetical protein
MQQKLLYKLLLASKKLCHYFQGHLVKVITNQPLEQILRNLNINGPAAEWAVELQPFKITFETTKDIKDKALAEFMAEWTDPFTNEPPDGDSTLPDEESQISSSCTSTVPSTSQVRGMELSSPPPLETSSMSGHFVSQEHGYHTKDPKVSNTWG